MRRVIIESPFAGTSRCPVIRWWQRYSNKLYARACLADALDRGESPFASHLLYTQPGVLDDRNPDERRKGILAGLDWADVADAVAVYVDRGVSIGMHIGIKAHREAMRPIEYRSIGRWR